MTVLVTRSADDARRTIETLSARGIAAIAAPAIDIVPVPAARFPASPAAIALTSANAVIGLPTGAGREALLSTPVFTTGDHTAEAATLAGFSDVRSAGGTADDLLRLVRESLKPDDGRIVYLSGRDISADFVGSLRAAGYEAQRIVVYEARPTERIPDAARQAIEHGQIAAILFYSARTLNLFARIADDAGLADKLSDVPAVVISRRVEDAAKRRGFLHTVVAETPDEPALIAAVEKLIATRLQA